MRTNFCKDEFWKLNLSFNAFQCYECLKKKLNYFKPIYNEENVPTIDKEILVCTCFYQEGMNDVKVFNFVRIFSGDKF